MTRIREEEDVTGAVLYLRAVHPICVCSLHGISILVLVVLLQLN